MSHDEDTSLTLDAGPKTFDEAVLVLTDLQRNFVLAYVLDPVKAKAALKAGYAKGTSGARGNNLWNEPRVRRAIDLWRKEQREQAELDAQTQIDHLQILAHSNILDFMGLEFDALGKPIVPDCLRPLWVAVQECTVVTQTTRSGAVIVTARVKLAPKVDAARLLAQLTGMLDEQTEGQGGQVNITINGPDRKMMFGGLLDDKPAATVEG